MDALRTGVFVLLLVPVCCEAGVFFTAPVTCYFLDGILIIYCITATVFYFREKFSSIPSEAAGAPEGEGGIYQELERPMDADPYQVLEPSKRKKKKAVQKKKSQTAQAEEGDKEPYESVSPSTSGLPLFPLRRPAGPPVTRDGIAD